jgi:hypothetical protein
VLEDRTVLSPLLTVNNLAVSGSNGAVVSNSGTFGDTTTGATVTLTASAGTVVQNSNGTWSWSETTPAGPAQTAPVTISAKDSNGQTAATEFWLNVGQVFVVTNTSNNGNTAGSLGWAVTQVDNDTTDTAAQPDLIAFNIPTSDPNYNPVTGAFTIQLPSAYYINNPAVIDGYTQSGASPNTLLGVQIPPPGSPPTTQPQGDNAALKIQIDLSAVTPLSGVGIQINADNSTIRGLVVNNMTTNVPYVSAIYLTGQSDHVEGNFIGTDVSGSSIVGGGTGTFGIHFNTSNEIVGGTTPDARNVIDGWEFGVGGQGVVEGNYIGTDASGTKALGNQIGVDGGTVGGTTPGAGNLISGNQTGIYAAIQVQGNLIGTDVTGTMALGNITGINGSNLIGGTTAAARNIISGNIDGITDEGNLIEGNYIGTDISGMMGLGNAHAGVQVLGGCTVGGTTLGAGNVISGNGVGVSGSNDGNLIEGNLIGTDYTGTKTIRNGFHGIDFEDGGNNNIIGGLDTNAPGQPLAGGGNLIFGGIIFSDSGGPAFSGNVVEGNYIGTDITGTKALGNADGVWLGDGATNNTIGGTTAAARNIISGITDGLGFGVFIHPNNAGQLPSGNVVEGNYIGTDVTGNNALGNGFGVVINGGINNLIGGTAAGAGNTIANNTDGVFLGNLSGSPPLPTYGNAILGNSIYGNSGAGILLFQTGMNDNQAAPVLTSASMSAGTTNISGTLQSVASTTFRVEFFANAVPNPSGNGEGKTYLGYVNVTTDATGYAPISFTLTSPLPAGQTVLSATATKLVGTSLTANDSSGFSRDVSIPSVGPITAPLAPVAINTTINTSASFTDAIPSNTHTAVWNWGDGSTSNGTVSESNGAGTVTGSHAYSVDGVYTVTLTVTNNGGGSGQSVFSYVVVYNPSAGFVTGGGWFNSPAGAYAANPTLTGQATFGLNAKYKTGSTVPTGNTDFHFPAANLDFKSTSYDWLVVNGNQAQYQGSGTINGAGNYGFLVTALDNDANSGGGVDTIRIEIWDKNNNNAVIYDTQPGAANTAPPTTPLGGGDIQIHTNAQTASVIHSASGSPSSSTAVADSVLSNLTPTPAASAGGASSNAAGWSAFQASLLGTIERDLIQWEEAMTKEVASLVQTVDQLFTELSAEIRTGESTVAPLA